MWLDLLRTFAMASRFIVISAIVFSFIHGMALSDNLPNEILLKIDHDPALQPQVITTVGSGHLVVAGESTAVQSAWAIKIDTAGRVLWSYVFSGRAEGVPISQRLLFTPKFSGAVAMSDGTTYLCGSLPRPPSQYYSPGLLVHLDTAGRELSVQYLLPKDRNAFGVARFTGCTNWGNGLAIIGYVWHVIRTGEQNAPIAPGAAYWLLTIDSDGSIKSEAQIRSSIKSSVLDVGPILSVPHSGTSLVFGATDSLNTEFVRVNETGAVESTRLLTGHYELVRPVASDGPVQAFGTSFSEPYKKVVLTLDGELNESQRIEGPHPTDFAAHLAYRMPDGSLTLFGSAKNSFGAGFHSSIAHVAANLSSEEQMELPRDKIDDEYSIWAATPASSVGEFAVARMAIAHALSAKNPDGTDPVGDFSRGAAIDFMRIK